MKYATRSQRNLVPIPREQGVALFQAAKEWVKARLADGTLDCVYSFADLSGGLAIGNADSHEELMDRILDYPMYPFFDWEVEPLCDFSHSMDRLIEWWQTLPG
ncbi:MAG: muconolactone Delta-isomerase family protein [Anaerolineae bacterium]